MRDEVDRVLALLQGEPLEVISVVPPGTSYDDGLVTELHRGLAPILVSTATRTQLAGREWDQRPVLVTNLDTTDLAELGPLLGRGGNHVVGYHEALGYWLLAGDVASTSIALFDTAAHRPFGPLLAGVRTG